MNCQKGISMEEGTPIYGHSRGYRMLSAVALAGALLSIATVVNSSRPPLLFGTVALAFGALFFFSWYQAARRSVVMTIGDEGFALCDPAVALGLLRFEDIQEIRIYATLDRPRVAFQIREPGALRCREPLLLRLALCPVWAVRRYQIVLELDRFNDQIMAVKTTALKAGIPVVSELV
ncbi:hypothetical protein [Alkalispirochaeta alkalica]|uniref:hypothetical protein n=1 Tax=Alkalispirochaeta alkalica TaxID=46356 RepID=UPI0012FE5718|nr:hypothetical protein [Alkalispirochaeta alkalica]